MSLFWNNNSLDSFPRNLKKGLMMSIMDSLISVVKTASPLIATALGSPLSGLALSLIGNLFGATTKNPGEILNLIKNDPDFEMRIKKLEFDHIEELSRISSADYQTEVDDRKDARAKEKDIHDKTPAILAYVLTFGVFSSLMYLFAFPVPNENKELIVSIISTLATVWIAAMAYYHGSSIGSRNKEKMLGNK